MSTAAEPRGGTMARAGDSLALESRTSPCPGCGAESIEVRYAPPAHLSESVKARLEPERPYVRQLCTRCIAQREADQAAERLARKRALALEAIEVPKLYATVSLDTFDVAGDAKLQAALTFARVYVASWPEVPLISVFAGGCGTGKGHLVWSIAKALAESAGVVTRVTVLSDCIRDLREAWNSDGGPSEAQRLGRYRAAELLVIDEVSRHAFFGQPQQHLYDLVAWREVRMRPTILTSNELGDDLSAVLGPALTSRAIGADGFVHFGDRDYRVATKGRRTA